VGGRVDGVVGVGRVVGDKREWGRWYGVVGGCGRGRVEEDKRGGKAKR